MVKILCEKDALEKALRVAEVCSGSKGDPSSFVFLSVSALVPEEGGDPVPLVNLYSGAPRRPQAKTPLVVSSVEGSGTLSLEAWRLRQWLSAAVGDQVSLSLKDKNVHVSIVGKKGEVRFPCAPIADFVFAEQELGRSVRKISMDKVKFLSMLRYAKSFCSTEAETIKPNLAVADVGGGRMWASKSLLCAILESEELKEGDFVIYAGHVSEAVAFLATVQGATLEILEDPGEPTGEGGGVRKATFLSVGGSVLELPWFDHRFPRQMFKEKELTTPGDMIWTVDTKGLRSAIRSVTASAPVGNDSLRLVYVKGEELGIRIPSVTGGDDTVYLPLECTGSLDLEALEIKFSLVLFQTLLDQHRGDQFSLEIFPKDPKVLPGKGKVAVRSTHDNCNYLTFLVWAS